MSAEILVNNIIVAHKIYRRNTVTIIVAGRKNNIVELRPKTC